MSLKHPSCCKREGKCLFNQYNAARVTKELLTQGHKLFFPQGVCCIKDNWALGCRWLGKLKPTAQSSS